MSEASSDHVEEVSGSRACSIRKPPEKAKDCPSSLSSGDIASLVETYPCLAKYHPYIPDDEDERVLTRTHSPPPGKVALYKAYFTSSGLRLPLTPFYIRVLSFYKIGICQLHPFAAGKIIRFEMISRALGQPLSLYMFRHIFLLARTGDWFTFTYRDKKYKLLDTPSKLTTWRFDFFFVDDCFIPNVPENNILRIGRDASDKVLNTGVNVKVASVMIDPKHHKVLRNLCIPYRSFPPRLEGLLAMVGISPDWDWKNIPVIMDKSTGERMTISSCICDFCICVFYFKHIF